MTSNINIGTNYLISISLSASSCSCLTCQEENHCTESTSENFYEVLLHLNIILRSLIAPFLVFTIHGYRAYIYFSTPVPKDLVAHIKCDTSVMPRIGALREVSSVLSYCIAI